MIERPFFVVNPRSAGGETGRLWELSLKKQVQEVFPSARWAFTAAEGQGSRLAELGWREGADLVVAVGGDGTVNEVVNGLMGQFVGDTQTPLPRSQGAGWPEPTDSLARPALGVIPRGTGCDFARSIAMPKDFRLSLQVLARGQLVRSDVGHLEYTLRKGGMAGRYFINIAGCGANGEVVQRVNRSGKQLGGFLSFFLASFQTTLRYATPKVELKVDGNPVDLAELNVLFVCNGQFCGAGMQVGKGASLTDGKFRVLEIRRSSRLTSLVHGSKVYSGDVEHIPGARLYDAHEVRASASEEVLIDCDGEQPGVLPAVWKIIPGALVLCVGAEGLAVKGAPAAGL